LGYLPRWIILSIDICILFISAVITFFLLQNLTLKFYDTLSVPVRYALIIAVNAVYFLFFKTYAGIIRHSTFIDGIKILLSTFFGFVTLLLSNYSSYFITGQKIYLVPGLLFNFVLNFSLLFLFPEIIYLYF